tara:strand:- start:131 stop:931 length:801 start_codon:yes stop_codon:yes gene_type:complete
MKPSDPRTAPAVETFLRAVIDVIVGKVAIIKPQSAFFEQLGWRGIKALDAIIQYARDKDILVLMDAKRGDIGTTAKAYAETYLSKEALLLSDALTVNPFLGKDTLEPYLTEVKDNNRGLFILVKTSNPGSGDYQNVLVKDIPLYEFIGNSLRSIASEFVGSATGWSSIGIVVGATYPEQADRLREILPNVPFLIPGYGAQGGAANDAVTAFVKGSNGYEGGIVNSSRGILFSDGSYTSNPKIWESTLCTSVQHAIDGLIEALARRA